MNIQDKHQGYPSVAVWRCRCLCICGAHFVQVVVLPDPCSPTNMTTFGLPFLRPLAPPPLPPFLSFSFSFGFAAPLRSNTTSQANDWELQAADSCLDPPFPL